jgi:hypothetical protein
MGGWIKNLAESDRTAWMAWWEAWHQEVLDQTTVQMAHWNTLELIYIRVSL